MTLIESLNKLNLNNSVDNNGDVFKLKTLLFKSKKSNLPIVVLANVDSPTSGSDIGKRINLKDIRAGDDQLWLSLFKTEKANANPFSLGDVDYHLVLDQSVSNSSSNIEIKHPDGQILSIDPSTLTDILKSNAKKFEQIDFNASLQQPPPSSTITPNANTINNDQQPQSQPLSQQTSQNTSIQASFSPSPSHSLTSPQTP